MITKLPTHVLQALEIARRMPGWNDRPAEAQKFDLPDRYGREPCRLIVVPARKWVYRKWERLAAAHAAEDRRK